MKRVGSLVFLVLAVVTAAWLLYGNELIVDEFFSGHPANMPNEESRSSSGRGAGAATSDNMASANPVISQGMIDGHGELDFEHWRQVINGRPCSEAMTPDVATVAEVLENRYENGEVEASVFLAAIYSCDRFNDRPGYSHERQQYWARIAAGHDLLWGHRVLAMVHMEAIMGYAGNHEPGPVELEHLRQSWHEAVLRAYEINEDPDDLWNLAASYSHTYGPIFDADRAVHWLRRWAEVGDTNKVAVVGHSLITQGQGGYADSSLGAELLVQAGHDGQPGAMIELLEFLSACEGAAPERGLPAIDTVYADYMSLYDGSVRASIALATAQSRQGDFNAAYATLLEAQYIQQSEDPNDVESLQMLAELANRVQAGEQLSPVNFEGQPCDPPGNYPDES